MKKLITCFFMALITWSCQVNSKKDTSPLSGIINENDNKSKIVEKLADSSFKGTLDLAKDYFDPDENTILIIQNMT